MLSAATCRLAACGGLRGALRWDSRFDSEVRFLPFAFDTEFTCALSDRLKPD